MTMKIDAGSDIKRGDLFFIDPYAILVRNELRGRHTPPSEEDVVNMAESMLDFGQIEPVEARRLPDHKLELTLGFTRTAAARMIREGFTIEHDGEKVERKDPQFKLKVVVVDTNDETAFKRNVVENARRNMTTPIDDAFNQERLRGYGMNDVEISKLYGYPNSSKVSRLHKLLMLEKAEQMMVHEGTLSVQAAIDLLDLPADKRKETIEAAKAENGKVSSTQVRSLVRDHHLSDDAPATPGGSDDLAFLGGAAPAAGPALKFGGSQPANLPVPTGNGNESQKSKSRNMRELRLFYEGQMNAEDQDPSIVRFCKDTLAYMAGKTTDKAMVNALNRLLEAKKGK